jgi:hypothetical protein
MGSGSSSVAAAVADPRERPRDEAQPHEPIVDLEYATLNRALDPSDKRNQFGYVIHPKLEKYVHFKDGTKTPSLLYVVPNTTEYKDKRIFFLVPPSSKDGAKSGAIGKFADSITNTLTKEEEQVNKERRKLHSAADAQKSVYRSVAELWGRAWWAGRHESSSLCVSAYKSLFPPLSLFGCCCCFTIGPSFSSSFSFFDVL